MNNEPFTLKGGGGGAEVPDVIHTDSLNRHRGPICPSVEEEKSESSMGSSKEGTFPGINGRHPGVRNAYAPPATVVCAGLFVNNSS